MPAFFSVFDKKVDPKGRVSVPVTFRRKLDAVGSGGLVAYPSFDGKPTRLICLPLDNIDQVVERNKEQSLDKGEFTQILTGASHNRILEKIMRLSHELPFDKEGRIVLSPRLCKEVGIDGAVVFVGVGDHFEIRSPEADREYERLADEAAGFQPAADRDGQP